MDVSRPRASSGLHSPHGGPGSPGLSGCRGDASAGAPHGQVPATPRPSTWAVPPPAPSLDFPLPWGQTTGQSPPDSGGSPSASSRVVSSLSPGFTTSYHMFVLSSPSPSRPPLVESSVGPSCSSPSTPPRPCWESEASPWDTSSPWQSSPMSCAGSPLASAAAPWDSPEDPSYSPSVPRLLGPWAHPTQEASAPAPSPPGAGPGSSLGSPMAPGSSPPCTPPSRRREAEASPPDTKGPWQTSPVSSAESPLSWGTEPWEPRVEPRSHQRCRPEAEASPPGPWQTSPISSEEYPLDWGPDPAAPPEATISSPSCTPRRGWRDAERSPPGASGPWQTSPISSAESPESWGAGTWETHGAPCTPPRRRREAEPSLPPGPWPTSCASWVESPLGSPTASCGSPMAPHSSPTAATRPPERAASRLERPVLTQTSWLDSLPFSVSPAGTPASFPVFPRSPGFPLGWSQGVPAAPPDGFFPPHPGQGSGPPEPGSRQPLRGAGQCHTHPRHRGPPTRRPHRSHPCSSACYCQALRRRREAFLTRPQHP